MQSTIQAPKSNADMHGRTNKLCRRSWCVKTSSNGIDTTMLLQYQNEMIDDANRDILHPCLPENEWINRLFKYWCLPHSVLWAFNSDSFTYSTTASGVDTVVSYLPCNLTIGLHWYCRFPSCLLIECEEYIKDRPDHFRIVSRQIERDNEVILHNASWRKSKKTDTTSGSQRPRWHN